MKVTITDTTPLPTNRVYSLHLEDLRKEDLLFIHDLFFMVVGGSPTNSPRMVTDEVCEAIRKMKLSDDYKVPHFQRKYGNFNVYALEYTNN